MVGLDWWWLVGGGGGGGDEDDGLSGFTSALAIFSILQAPLQETVKAVTGVALIDDDDDDGGGEEEEDDLGGIAVEADGADSGDGDGGDFTTVAVPASRYSETVKAATGMVFGTDGGDDGGGEEEEDDWGGMAVDADGADGDDATTCFLPLSFGGERLVLLRGLEPLACIALCLLARASSFCFLSF